MNQSNRIYFLDFSRSVAILLMLQGHFISMTLESYPHYMKEIELHGTSGNIWFTLWGSIRGLTAPLFFIITGTVFSFLLHREWNTNPGKYFQLNRVKKGFKRVLSLLVIGYALQLNLKYFNYYLAGHFNPRFLAFHILQCIGMSLFLILILTPLISSFKKYCWLIYLLLSLFIFVLTFVFRTHSGFLPMNAHPFFQNMLQGPETGFSLLPWSGFVLFGAGFGHFISVYGTGDKNKKVYLFLILSGLAFHSISLFLMLFNGDVLNPSVNPYPWLFERVFHVTLLLAVLTYLSSFSKLRPPFFMVIGQETLVIYVLHAMVLYGAVTGLGLRSLWENKFSTLEAILGSLVFLLSFMVFAQFLNRIRSFFSVLFKYVWPHGN